MYAYDKYFKETAQSAKTIGTAISCVEDWG